MTGRQLDAAPFNTSFSSIGPFSWDGVFFGDKKNSCDVTTIVLKDAESTEQFTRTCNDRTRGNSYKLKEGKFSFDIRKIPFFLVWHWNSLPRETPHP